MRTQVRWRNDREHFQRGVAKERDMDLAGGEVFVGFVEIDVVLGNTGAVADGFSEGHMVHEPVGQPRPYARECITVAGDSRPEEIVFVVPVAEITPVEDHKDGLGTVAGEVGRAADRVRLLITSATGTVGPKVRLAVQGGEERIWPDDLNVTWPKKETEMTPCIDRRSITIQIAKIVADQSPAGGGEFAMAKPMVLLEITPEEIGFGAGKERGHVPEIDAPNFQFNRGREGGLVELAVARIVIVVAMILAGY